MEFNLLKCYLFQLKKNNQNKLYGLVVTLIL